MSTELTLTKTRLISGVWEGILTGAVADQTPRLVVTHLGTVVEGVQITQQPDDRGWHVRIPIPAEMISDGVLTFLITEPESGEVLNSFTLLSGEGLAEDIRAEMSLLRAELDMLKRAFRRHCVETT